MLLSGKRCADQLSVRVALFEVHFQHFRRTIGLHLHKFGAVLCCGGTEAVETEGIFIMGIIACIVIILAACVKLAVYELPVVFALVFVVIQRNTAAEVLDGDDAVACCGDVDAVAVSFSCFVNGIGKYFKYGMFTAFKSIRAEDHGGTFADTVRTFEKLDTVVIVYLCFFRHSAVNCPFFCEWMLGLFFLP